MPHGRNRNHVGFFGRNKKIALYPFSWINRPKERVTQEEVSHVQRSYAQTRRYSYDHKSVRGGAFFLLPTELINEIITYWLARAKCRYGRGLHIYGYLFLSNHFHLFCKDTEGTLAEFMEYFQGNVARAINRAIGRGPAHFWQGHYDDQIVDGEKAFWNKYVYIMTNAVKSGLVKRVEDWAGVNSFKAAITGEPIRGAGLNRTRYHNANRGNKKRPKSDFMETY